MFFFSIFYLNLAEGSKKARASPVGYIFFPSDVSKTESNMSLIISDQFIVNFRVELMTHMGSEEARQ